ncbi:hypothetical protein G7Y89_g9942 [Cudoniella acicularis]|uniref:Uncharacterized protein n=1 Tax=Cudoniella acicularis TaxID=354080 RepID=A0A8H4VZJ1_9HELO|nr:hypothetical protein G7Y89_g9942 [Cudoniella acicularis]
MQQDRWPCFIVIAVCRNNNITAVKSRNIKPYFPPSLHRQIYLSLLNVKPPVEESALVAAFLLYAVEIFDRVIWIHTALPACKTLWEQSSIGEEELLQLVRANKELDKQLLEIIEEAEDFRHFWGLTLFRTAMEISNNLKLRESLAKIEGKKDEEKEWWEARRKAILDQLMVELGPDVLHGSPVESPSSAKKAKGAKKSKFFGKLKKLRSKDD